MKFGLRTCLDLALRLESFAPIIFPIVCPFLKNSLNSERISSETNSLSLTLNKPACESYNLVHHALHMSRIWARTKRAFLITNII